MSITDLLREREKERKEHGITPLYKRLTVQIGRLRDPNIQKRSYTKRKALYKANPQERERVLSNAAAWRKSEAGRAYYREYFRNRRTNPQAIWKDRMDHAVRNFVYRRPNPNGVGRAVKYNLGDHAAFVAKLKEGFDRGEQLDHIRPCCSFDLTDPIARAECYALDNLQTLPKLENLRKGVTLQQHPLVS